MFKKILNEFKTFALKGNMLDLAVGVIIGGAFQGVVTSLTQNILSPIIGIFAQQNFDTLAVNILGTTLYYGAFLTSLVNFFIMAFVVFLLVKGINTLAKVGDKKSAPASPTEETPKNKKCPYCLSEIPYAASRCPHCTSEISITFKQ